MQVNVEKFKINASGGNGTLQCDKCYLCLKTLVNDKGVKIHLSNIFKFLKLSHYYKVQTGARRRGDGGSPQNNPGRDNVEGPLANTTNKISPATICQPCYRVTGSLSECIRQLELIQMKVNHSLENFCQLLRFENEEVGNVDMGVPQKANRDHTPECYDELLKKGAKEKCVKLLKSSQPRVVVIKLDEPTRRDDGPRVKRKLEVKEEIQLGPVYLPRRHSPPDILNDTMESYETLNGLQQMNSNKCEVMLPQPEEPAPKYQKMNMKNIVSPSLLGNKLMSNEKCLLVAPFKSDTSQHLNIPSGKVKTNYKCDICEDSFELRISLEQHKVQKHVVSNHQNHKNIMEHDKGIVKHSPSYNCEHCGSVFSTFLNLQYHLEYRERCPKLMEEDLQKKGRDKVGNLTEFDNFMSSVLNEPLVVPKEHSKPCNLVQSSSASQFSYKCTTCNTFIRTADGFYAHTLKNHPDQIFVASKSPIVTRSEFRNMCVQLLHVEASGCKKVYVALGERKMECSLKCQYCLEGGFDVETNSIQVHLVKKHRTILIEKLEKMQANGKCGPTKVPQGGADLQFVSGMKVYGKRKETKSKENGFGIGSAGKGSHVGRVKEEPKDFGMATPCLATDPLL